VAYHTTFTLSQFHPIHVATVDRNGYFDISTNFGDLRSPARRSQIAENPVETSTWPSILVGTWLTEQRLRDGARV